MVVGILEMIDPLRHDPSLHLRFVTPEIDAIHIIVRKPDTVVMAVADGIMGMPHPRQADAF